MTKLSAIALTLLASLIANEAGAASVSDVAAKFPSELIYKNQPIEPRCMDSLSNYGMGRAVDTVTLEECSKQGADNLMSGPITVREDGSIGYDYKTNDGESDEYTLYGGYTYYRYVGKIGDTHVIAVYSNGGGTGHFSALIKIVREGDALRVVERTDAGDRCNGGLEGIEIKDGKLYYASMITPYDFIGIAEGDIPIEVDTNNGLEGSAASCAGVAQYEDGKLISVKLAEESGYTADDKSGWTELFAYQSCFNAIYRDYLGRKKTMLSIKEFKQFSYRFVQTCLKKGG